MTEDTKLSEEEEKVANCLIDELVTNEVLNDPNGIPIGQLMYKMFKAGKAQSQKSRSLFDYIGEKKTSLKMLAQGLADGSNSFDDLLTEIKDAFLTGEAQSQERIKELEKQMPRWVEMSVIPEEKAHGSFRAAFFIFRRRHSRAP